MSSSLRILHSTIASLSIQPPPAFPRISPYVSACLSWFLAGWMEWGSDSCGGTVNTGREREREKKIIILSATGWRRTEGEGDTGTATSITLSHSWEKHNSQVKTSTCREQRRQVWHNVCLCYDESVENNKLRQRWSCQGCSAAGSAQVSDMLRYSYRFEPGLQHVLNYSPFLLVI